MSLTRYAHQSCCYNYGNTYHQSCHICRQFAMLYEPDTVKLGSLFWRSQMKLQTETLSHFEKGCDTVTRQYMHTSVWTFFFLSVHVFSRKLKYRTHFKMPNIQYAVKSHPFSNGIKFRYCSAVVLTRPQFFFFFFLFWHWGHWDHWTK